MSTAETTQEDHHPCTRPRLASTMPYLGTSKSIRHHSPRWMLRREADAASYASLSKCVAVDLPMLVHDGRPQQTSFMARLLQVGILC